MLSTAKIPAFVQRASFEGKDEKKFVRFEFYITPCTWEIADEMSPAIAQLLFRRDGVNFGPVLELDDAHFEIGSVPLQTMEMHPVDDPAMDLHGVLLTGVQISNVSARKIFPDDPNFTLIFRAELPKNELVVKMMDRYFREKVHLTFAPMQGEMFPDADVKDAITNPTCEECDDRAIARDSEKTYLCQKHLRKAKGEVTMIVTKETPAQAEARVLAERDGKMAAAGKDDAPGLVMGGTMTPTEDADDMSHANKPKGGRRRTTVN